MIPYSYARTHLPLPYLALLYFDTFGALVFFFLTVRPLVYDIVYEQRSTLRFIQGLGILLPACLGVGQHGKCISSALCGWG